LAQGWIANRGNGTFFRNGKWVGLLPLEMRVEKPWFQSCLSLPESAGWETLPSAFASLLHAGRISGSERVLTRRFLGQIPPVSVLSIQLDCHGDSAWIYVAPGMPKGFAENLIKLGFNRDSSHSLAVSRKSPDFPPLRLEFFPQGMVGVEGCFDSFLTERWFQAQGNALKTRNFGK
jgi:hypothetical protein